MRRIKSIIKETTRKHKLFNIFKGLTIIFAGYLLNCFIIASVVTLNSFLLGKVDWVSINFWIDAVVISILGPAITSSLIVGLLGGCLIGGNYKNGLILSMGWSIGQILMAIYEDMVFTSFPGILFLIQVPVIILMGTVVYDIVSKKRRKTMMNLES